MLNDPLPIPVAQVVLDALIEGIRRSNWQASRNFSPDEGSNGSTFGNDRQHFTYFWMIAELHGACPDVRAKVQSNSFCAEWEDFELRAYAGGHGLDWDVKSWDFTGTTLRRAIVNANRKRHKRPRTSVDQGQLDGMGLADVPNPEEFTKLVVVTATELTTGKVAIYLGAPSMEAERPCWAWVRCIYRDTKDSPGYGFGESDLDEGPVTPPMTPYHQLAQPEFDLDVKPKAEPSEGEG
jgi:hypothetical protein